MYKNCKGEYSLRREEEEVVVDKGDMQCRKREKVMFLLQHRNDNSSHSLHYMPQYLLVPIGLPKGTFLPICMPIFIH